MRRENVTPLPYPEGLLGEETLRVIREYYAPDYRSFDYPEPEADPSPEEAARRWKERTDILLDSVRVLISHNERLTTLNESLQEARRQAATACKTNERLRREVAQRHTQVMRLRNRVKSLQEIQGSRMWRYTAPARRLIEEAKRAKGRLRGDGTSG